MKCASRMMLLTVLGVICISKPTGAQESHANSDKVIHAVRAQEVISVDGVLDDAAWAYASPVGDFRQSEPEQDVAPSESTLVQIVYDDTAIYFGFTLFDSEPEKIEKRLARRDRAWEGDRVYVGLDPYLDHRTGFYFLVNAAGVEGDGLIYNDGREDGDWDGVWDSQVKVTDFGWVAEIKIPYHTIRFAEKDIHVWGVNFTRDIFRLKERSMWAPVWRGENGWVSRFGHIEGIEKINPPMRLQAVPYILSSGQLAPVAPSTPKGNAVVQRIGGDFKYGLTSNMTLDATLNPDFGQVEADEAVLNLSTFEAFFPEKRPFFIEGSQIFDTPMGLFYSRRIGRAPSGEEDLRGGLLLDKPRATSIQTAGKMSGRTTSGLTIGAISALTAQERAIVADSLGTRYSDIIEPQATYNVLRLKQDILKNSFIGLMATNAARQGESPATTGGVDWRLNFRDNMYNFRGQVAVSRTGQGRTSRETGVGTELSFSKGGGDHFGFGLNYEGLSPDFNINDLGFLRRSDIHTGQAWFNIRGNNPWRFTRRRFINFNSRGSWNFKGTTLNEHINMNTNIQFTNWWWFGGGHGRTASVQDDLETRDNGLVQIPNEHFTWFWIESDFRQKLAGGVNFEFGKQRDGTFRSFSIFSRMQVLRNLQIQFGPRFNQRRGVSRWVENVDNPSAVGSQISVFGEQDTDNFSVVTRANITFTKDLSLQFYNQLFFAAGKYRNFKSLQTPTTFGPLASGIYTGNPDFNNRSMNVNAVLRWEYRPGSTLFLVWTQARSGSGTPGDAAFLRNLGGIFDASSENILLMKFNYWWNI
ncbi:MAG: carbohydrate binding family 9 domain-containing protein [Candidatus Latescibacteria bacterium]|nr:carbohydrate binding family 9 domain-containing protein [Candidatus Latescibacterota bacterium]